MTTIFLSWYDGFLQKKGEHFLKLLQSSGFSIITSPWSPNCEKGHDPKWDNWYDDKLPKAIDRSDIFIAYISPKYDSTWMQIEFNVAFRKNQIYGIPKLLVYNPDYIKLPVGFQTYIANSSKLPSDIFEAINTIADLTRLTDEK